MSLFASREKTISVCLPSRNEEATIGAALAPLVQMHKEALIEQLVVVDESTDWTGEIADSMGATVYRQCELAREYGYVVGKGDALWRSLEVLTGDIILFLDADSTSIQRHYVFAMCAPLLEGNADMVKAHYERPLGGDPDGGGRVNHLLARPLLRAHFPGLEWVKQPLAGETALMRETAHSLPFVCGYGVEIGLLIDAHTNCLRIAQADLHRHEHRHRPLGQLSTMADEILQTVLDRAELTHERSLERPPWFDHDTPRANAMGELDVMRQ